MNISYEETKQCMLYHFKCKVLISKEHYLKMYNKTSSRVEGEKIITFENRRLLEATIRRDVKNIFDNYMILYNNDFRIDWKIQDFVDVVKKIAETAQN